MNKELYLLQHNKKDGYVLLVLNEQNKSAYAYQRLADGTILEGEASIPYEQIESQYAKHGININSLPTYGVKE